MPTRLDNHSAIIWHSFTEAFVVGHFSEIQNSNKLVQTQYPSDIQQKCNCYLVMLLVSCTHHGPWLVESKTDTEPFLQQGLTWVIKARTKILFPGDITNIQIVRAQDDDNCTHGAIFGSVTNSVQGKTFLELTFVFMRSGGWNDHWTWACQLRGDYPIHISIHHRDSLCNVRLELRNIRHLKAPRIRNNKESLPKLFMRWTNFSRNLTSGLSRFFSSFIMVWSSGCESSMVFIIATKFDMHDSLNVFYIYVSGPKVLIELWQHDVTFVTSRALNTELENKLYKI